MSTPGEPSPVQLFFAVLARPDSPTIELRRRLESLYSSICAEMTPYPFSQSTYYEPEMGPNLKKSIWLCQDLIGPGELVEIKLHTNEIEREYAGERGRLLNIDPGYLHLARVILATGKDNAHRIYVGHGIYEELTLLYRRKWGFEPLPWTYPDFRTPQVLEFLNRSRDALHNRLKDETPAWKSI